MGKDKTVNTMVGVGNFLKDGNNSLLVGLMVLGLSIGGVCIGGGLIVYHHIMKTQI